jgi:hypothetical protein
MSIIVRYWFTVLVVTLSAPVYAQYASVTEAANSRHSATQKVLEAAREKYLGRTFWIVPDADAFHRNEFLQNFRYGEAGGRGKFVVAEATSFVVEAFDEDETGGKYVKVRFPDGKIAYLEEYPLFDGKAEYPLFKNLLRPGERRQKGDIEHILPMSPEQFRTAERKRREKSAAVAAADAATRKARGGVRVGMTAEQVRASNWGKPEKINRSTGSYGVHEQWVYGSGNYIYLENGAVSSIQN